MKEKIILFDHACHKKTKSFLFMEQLLSRRFDVTVHMYDAFYEYKMNKKGLKQYNYAVYCQFLPGRFKVCHEGVKAIFIPMYDGEWGSYWFWRRIALTKMSIVSFSKKLSQRARACGVTNLLDVQFFPDISQYEGMKGDPRVLLLWERGDAKFELITKLFRPGDLKKIILFRHPEENISYKDISSADMALYNVNIINTPFLPKEEFLTMMKEVGTVVAPRKKEGIGMSFLEPLAMGKCVIAHNDATMNEYIVNGVNGLLIDFDNPKRMDIDSICHIHSQMTNLANYRQQWAMDQEKIIDFIENSKVTSLTLLDKYFYWLSFIPYLAEWVIFRLKGARLS